MLLCNNQHNLGHGMKFSTTAHPQSMICPWYSSVCSCVSQDSYKWRMYKYHKFSSVGKSRKQNKIYLSCKGYFLAPPSAACFSAAFFCFSLIIAASLNRMK